MKRSLSVAMLIVGSFLGAGFASGREFVDLFDNGGTVFILMPLWVAILVFLLSFVYLQLASKMLRVSINQPVGINEFLLKKYSIFGDLFMLINSFVLLSIMISTIDTVGFSFGMRYPSLGTICTIIVGSVVIGGIGRILKVNNILCPILILILIFTYVFSIHSLSGLSFQTSNIFSNSLGAIGYVCFNLYLSVKVLTRQRTLTNQQIWLSSGLAAIIVGIFMTIIILAITKDKSIFYSDLPLISIAENYGSVSKILAATILVICAMNTLMIAFFSIFEWLDIVYNKVLRCAIIALIGIVISRLGYATIIIYIYPTLSIICILFMSLAIIKLTFLQFSNKKSNSTSISNQPLFVR